MSYLGDMIRLGAKKKPQAHGYWVSPTGATCALGAAGDAVFGVEGDQGAFVPVGNGMYENVDSLMRKLVDERFGNELNQAFNVDVVIPLMTPDELERYKDGATLATKSLRGWITTMNDCANFTRERIAEIVDVLLDKRFVTPVDGAAVVASILEQSAPLTPPIAGPELVQEIVEATKYGH